MPQPKVGTRIRFVERRNHPQVLDGLVGYDRTLKTNTSKRREHSLFRQGCMVYDLIPTMPERWLHQLM
jgi:hypothetical protein